MYQLVYYVRALGTSRTGTRISPEAPLLAMVVAYNNREGDFELNSKKLMSYILYTSVHI